VTADATARPVHRETAADRILILDCGSQFTQLIARRVREARAVTSLPHIEREMALIDVNAKAGAERQEILNIVGIFRAKVVDLSHERMILEASGTKDKVDTFIELLKPFRINDVTRTGAVAINRLSPFEQNFEAAG